MKTILMIFPGVLILFTTTFAVAGDTLTVGDRAPEFALPFATRDSVGEGKVSLLDFVGKRNIVLAFYPADWSGGCTKEVCTMRDNFSSLSQLDAEIFGISGDYPYSHQEWAKHHNLPFLLLSDHNHEVAKRYNSYNDATGYNRRTVFVIDKQGRIAYANMHYSVQDMTSFDELQSVLKKLP